MRLVVRPAPRHATPATPHADRTAIFARLGCNECHAVSALAWRYDMSLEAFLANPPGVMRLVLASHVNLSFADRTTIVRILKQLHEERRAASDGQLP